MSDEASNDTSALQAKLNEAAQVLVRQYGERAEEYAILQFRTCASKQEWEEAAVWRRLRDTIFRLDAEVAAAPVRTPVH